MAKVKIDGTALSIVNSITEKSADELNNRRFSRLCGMLKSQDLVWKALKEHDKDGIVREARDRLGVKAYA